MFKKDMDYTFEKMYDGKYQVRLGGEFVCYAATPDPDYVDEKLFQYGWSSREEYYQAGIKELLASLQGEQ